MVPGRGFGTLLLAGLALQVPGAPMPQRLSAQAPPAPPALSPRQQFDQSCQTCHGNPAVPRAADPSVLRRMTPERIYDALTTGVMQSQAQALSDQARRGIAEYLGDRKLGAGASGAVDRMPNRCEAAVQRARGDAAAVAPRTGTDGAPTCRTHASSLPRRRGCQPCRCRAWR